MRVLLPLLPDEQADDDKELNERLAALAVSIAKVQAEFVALVNHMTIEDESDGEATAGSVVGGPRGTTH